MDQRRIISIIGGEKKRSSSGMDGVARYREADQQERKHALAGWVSLLCLGNGVRRFTSLQPRSQQGEQRQIVLE